ncbi:flagellar biosynthesis repressor FlbT [Roseomonas sp. GC11]|uniref:flagellar biosynthesis repressor FlbT n=1 Tax=Roseomonas sp. GC11 TaxID=2950546 RepID=UPI00210D4541|nr:flagellar biosynthesis repressor FlbT [Roseomonas sp. GC11]MCQ4161981.1 flagellar biosynthesis repressor FlbT [Roseomonas sp. GC11]
MSETRTPRGSGRLVLDLRAGDRMLVNGAALQFKTRTSVMLSNRARFLFGKQIMAPEDACTPSRRVYFAIQAAYVAEDDERAQFVAQARRLADEYSSTTTSPTARGVLAQAIADLEAGDCWEAMRRLRVLFAHDDAMLGAAAAPVAAQG